MSKSSWTLIRETLENEIATGKLSAGERLPTEPQLADRFGAGRHSVRRAVEALATEGKLSVEQGRGTFVETAPRLTYTLGRRTRLRKNLVPQGYEVGSEFLGSRMITPPARVAVQLDLDDGALVIESQRLTLAGSLPIAFGEIYHDASCFADIVERRETLGSHTAAYKSYGIEDYVRTQTSMFARSARPEEAKILKQHPDMPVLVIHAVDADLTGAPIACSHVVWSAARVTFNISGDGDGT